MPFPLLKPAESVLGVLSFALAHSKVYKNNVIRSPLMFIMICVSKVYLFALQQHCLIAVMSKSPPCCHALRKLHTRRIVTFEYVLIDRAYWCFVEDILLLQCRSLLRKGSIVVADNVLLPRALDYRRISCI